MGQQEANKQVVRAYVEAFNRGDMDALREIYAEDAVIQGVLGEGHMDKIVPIWRQLHESLAITLTVEEIIAEGDFVAVRYTERGTFRAPFLGQEPTGNLSSWWRWSGSSSATAKSGGAGAHATTPRRRVR